MKSISLAVRVFALNLFASVLILTGLYSYFGKITDANVRAQKSQKVAELVSNAALHFNEMTIGMRGFMLDPSLKSEWENKLRADQAATKVLKEAKAASFNPAVTAAIDEIAALDEKMDALENQFGDLVKEGSFKEANKFYFSSYLPIRTKMDGSLEKAHQITEADTAKYSEIEDKLVHAGGTWVAGGVFCVLLALLGINQWISNRLTKRIAQLSEEMSASAMSIELASKNTASASQQIATSATENASAITETLSMADAGRKEADRGRDVVSNMANSMREVFESNSKLESLIKVIEDIRSKTKVINDIVFETRLLAFNASIEAARAGSHGKGFAVVAEEVGKLASVSGKAAEEIHTLLEQSTQQVTDVVTTTSTRVTAARESSLQCEQVFNQMSISLNEINRAMQDMEKETHQNSASSEEMANQASTLAHESKALTSLVVRIRGLVLGNPMQETHAPAPVLPFAGLAASTPPKSVTPPKLKIVTPPKFTGVASPSDGEVGRDDLRWKVG